MEKRTHRIFKKTKSERRLRFSIRKFSVGIASVAIAAFAFLGANTVSADSLTNTDTANATAQSSSTNTDTANATAQSSSTVSSSENSTEPESEKITNKETSATSVDTSSTTSNAGNISSTGEENTKALSEKGNEERSSTTNSLNTNQEGLDAGETIENVLQNAVTVNGTTNVGKSTVTKDNFLDSFRLNGSATYDKDTGIVTLTTDKNNLVGNFTLKSKIDMSQSFNIDGEVNLGDKTKDQGGADGISFSFHDGNTTDVGQFGGNLGIGGLRSAESFKLDTYYNYYRKPNGDPSVSNEVYGWPADPVQPDGQFRLVYGSFAETKYEKINGYDRWWVHNDEARAQNLDKSDLDGKFHKFTINYDGTTKKLTVTYQSNRGLLTWEKTVKTVNEIMAMNVAASTGGSKNLQQFKINSFEYSQAASVDVAYVDTDGKKIGEGQATYPDGPYKGKTYKTEQKDIKGFTFKEIDSNGLPAEGPLSEWGTNGTVTYIYTRNIQKGKIQFLKDNKDGNAPVLEKELSVSGGSGTKVDRDITSELKNLSDKGFKVTSNTFTGDQYFDYDDNNDQVWKVIYEEQSEAFTESHKVTRKISYVYEDGKTDGRPTLKDSVTQEAEFTREGTRNPVTKTIQKVEAWKPSDKKLSEETTPVVPGFIADKTKVDELTVTPESPNTDVVVTYKKLGSWVPKVPDGFTPPPSIVYPNDPTDPTKPQKPTDPGYPVIPNVPGTTPVGPDGVTPLTPVDPNDPSKGYIPPSLPSEPGKDTPITYVQDDQKAIITFVNQNDNKELGKVTETGKSGEVIGRTNYESELKKLQEQGYRVVKDEFKDPQNFDKDSKTDQQYTVTLEEPIVPFDPTNPPKPTDPIDPENPIGPKWDDEKIKQLTDESVKDFKRTISYVYEDGTEASPSFTDTARFTRKLKVNVVTKEIVERGDWISTDDVVKGQTSPVIKGYLADKASVSDETLTAESVNPVDVVVTYKKLGSWVPKVPDGFTPPPSIVYPNDPTDPTKPQKPTDPGYPVIPNVPGTTPVGPDGVTPLTPVDPNDPSKGYIPPSLPSEPGKDTPITYVENPKPDKPENPEPDKPENLKPLNYKPKGDDSSKAVLPNTGESTSSSLGLVGMLSAIIGVSLVTKRKKKTDEE